jgi:MtN3 and saliva related transmembrane protein
MTSQPDRLVQAVGFVAGLLTTLSLVPQVLKTWRLRSGVGLSFWMLLTFNVGVVLWIGYGLAVMSRPIVFWNGVTLSIGLLLIGLRIRYR